jgi:hypothetical protein
MQYKNAMALVRKFGKPTFFITFTLDTQCKEIQDELKTGQSPYDRPDLLARVFNAKMKALMHEIKKVRSLDPVMHIASPSNVKSEAHPMVISWYGYPAS